MARLTYGGSLADYGIDALGRPVPNTTYPVWTAVSGGVQLVDLLDDTGTPVVEASADARGFITFQAPDGTDGDLFLEDGDGDRFAIRPLGLGQAVADLKSAAALAAAGSPETLTTGTVTRNGSGAVTAATLAWPDGATGTFTADATSAGAVDAYHVTHVLGGTTTTYTQPAVTRDSTGAITVRPALVVT